MTRERRVNAQTRIWWLACLLMGLCFMPVIALANIEDTTGGQRLFFGHLQLGYQEIATDGPTELALPYSEQESYPTLDVASLWVKSGTHVGMSGTIEGEKDYTGEFDLDLNGRLRFYARDESLYHQLQPLPGLESPADGTVVYTNTAPDDRYDLQYRQQDMALKLTPTLLASHITVRYRRTLQDGKAPLHYLDENCTSQCHINGTSRKIDQESNEYSGMLDAHLGPIEASTEYLQRTFENEAPIPTDLFGGSLTPAQHDVRPGNRYSNCTIKVHTSLAGGLVAAASTSAGRRENETEQTDVAPIHAEADVLRASGDLTWIPTPIVSFVFRYRWTNIDNDVSSAYTSPIIVDIPEAIDINRNSFSGAVAIHATNKLTLKGGYRRDIIHRANVVDTGFWPLPEEENIDRFNADLQYLPFGRSSTRLDAGYQFTHSSDPAYAMASQDLHRVTANFRMNSAANWGMMASLRGESGENGGVKAPTSAGEYLFDRTNRKGDATVSAWVSPWSRLTLGGSFGYSDARHRQDLLFGHYGTTDVIADNVESRQIVRNASLNLNARLTDKLNGGVEVHRIRGSYRYNPAFADFIDGVEVLTAAGLGEIGSLEVIQDGLAANLSWEAMESWYLGARYTYDAYNDRKDDLPVGKVQTYMGTVAKTW